MTDKIMNKALDTFTQAELSMMSHIIKAYQYAGVTYAAIPRTFLNLDVYIKKIKRPGYIDELVLVNIDEKKLTYTAYGLMQYYITPSNMYEGISLDLVSYILQEEDNELLKMSEKDLCFLANAFYDDLIALENLSMIEFNNHNPLDFLLDGISRIVEIMAKYKILKEPIFPDSALVPLVNYVAVEAENAIDKDSFLQSLREGNSVLTPEDYFSLHPLIGGLAGLVGTLDYRYRTKVIERLAFTILSLLKIRIKGD